MTSEEEWNALVGKEREETVNDVEGHRARVMQAIEANPTFIGIPDYERLEYLLFFTIPRKDTKPIAKELLRRFGSLAAVFRANAKELLHVDGVGEKTAHFLAHVTPVVMDAAYARFENPHKLTTVSETAQYLYARFLGFNKEVLLMTSLNVNDEVIQTDEIAVGEVDCMSVDLKKVMRVADRNGAKKIILAHNHPGGTMQFSQADIDTTARIVSCCMLMGYVFYDHLIFSGNNYLSMFGSEGMWRVLDACDKQNAAIGAMVAQEKNRRNKSPQLGEIGATNDGNAHKLELLSAYRCLFAADTEESDALLRSLIHTVR